MSESEKPLWKCPKCGHGFVTENLWHACGRYSLADHFEDSDQKVRELFDRFTAMVEACGPVTIYPEETRIVCQVRVRFAGVVPRRRDLDVSVWLTRPVQHAKLRRTEMVPPSTFVHHFRFKHPSELNDAFMAIVQEGYAVGRQDHLERGGPRKPRRRRSGKRKRVEEGKPKAPAAKQERPEAAAPAAAAKATSPGAAESPAPEATAAARTATEPAAPQRTTSEAAAKPPAKKKSPPKRKTAKRTTPKTKKKAPATKKPATKRKSSGTKGATARDEKKRAPKAGGHDAS